MFGYMVLENDFFCRGFKCKVGETYSISDNLETRGDGFRFYENPVSVFSYCYPKKSLRFAKVQALGEIVVKYDKTVSNKIRIVEEISPVDYLNLCMNGRSITDCEAIVRVFAAMLGQFLNILICDDSEDVRRAVAKQNYRLDILVHDDDWFVRSTVAEQGYGLDVLVYDRNENVREAVARQGYGLNVLVNDEAWFVRMFVAKQGYGLDILIDDESWRVRATVASQGYGLDVLVHDEDENVRRMAREMLEKQNKQSKKY